MVIQLDIKEVEKSIGKFWNENDIYAKVKEYRRNGKSFYFCDGPPYATGEIHPGTAWNKAMKDAYCRYYRMKGYNVRDQAGFDTHGLPIEVKVEKKLGIKNKAEIESKIGVKNFINECKLFATKYIGVMSEQFRSVGVWLDFDDPYLTYKNSFIEKSWSTVKRSYEKGLLEEQLYVVPFCPRCETTSANYELEYKDKTDPSIFVKFKVKGADNKYLLIWTTTPWTLPANVAVMASPDETYVEAEVGTEVWILAKERLERVQQLTEHDMVILSEFSGRKLDGLEYEHPLVNEVSMQKNVKHRVVLSDKYVTMEEGTGLVHTAPGHGPEDFAVGKQYDLDILCPVDERGRFTEDAGKYKGYYVFDANKAIIKDLDDKNLIVYKSDIKHRYAHCWRCKTPLIYLATKQWFIEVSKLKEAMVSEINNTHWRPEYAKDQFRTFVSEAPDWCISRQRYWGIPLPIWRCKCGNIKVIGSKHELGVELDDLHRPEIDKVVLKCDKCGLDMHRVEDVLDVWFDSGNVVWASLKDGENYDQADLILEGKDQIRGWFYSLLGSGVVNIDKSPYKSVLMHGYFTDEKGEKMSKSVGNFVPLADILDRASVDAFRFWSMHNVPWDDLKFNWDELNDTKRFLMITLNLINYMQRFYEKPSVEYDLSKLEHEDKWILLKLSRLIDECTKAMDSLEMYKAPRAIKAFIVHDFSRFYMKIAKKRINEGINSESVHHVLYDVLFTLSKLIAPFAPYTAEYMYQKFFRKYGELESVHMLDWPAKREYEFDPVLVDEFDYADKIISAIGTARNNAKVKMRWPLNSVAVVSKNAVVENTVLKLSRIIEGLTNVKKVEFAASEQDVDYGEFAKVNADENLTIILDTHINQELYGEGIRNEFIRRIQAMRKEAGLVESDRIDVQFSANDEIASIIEKHLPYISNQVRAMTIKREREIDGGKEWRIDKNNIVIKILKL